MLEVETRKEFPFKVREIENTWIPMPDNTKLAARIWLPDGAEANPVPAILEYLPYRKRDGTVERDQLTHPYFAGHGYASVRVDLRGTGDSEGICQGEYLKQEQDDCVSVIDWLAKQPWCTGKVGMIGISWGGFNGLQLAARQPESLAAVVSLCSTDDRYADDIHFMGGAMLTDKLSWGATAFSIANTPPDPAIVGNRWREMWTDRLKSNGLWMIDWFKHQRRDEFYAHGSICENYSDIKIPVYLVGGYADGYTNPIFRMMQHLPGLKKALIGPWAHKYPHFATPGPRIGFLQECLRWWDQHLKGINTGIMEEPPIRAWIQDPAPPDPSISERPGKWISEQSWPPANQSIRKLHISATGLQNKPLNDSDQIVIESPENSGHTAQTWCVYGTNADGALDQQGESGLMKFFDSSPLEEDLEIFGFPMLHARVSSNVPQANLAAVLSMVAPDEKATLVSFGVLNLTHRASHSMPAEMPIAEFADVKVQLNVIGQRIPKGYRVRLQLSSAYWPMIWPSAAKAQLILNPEGTFLELPLRSGTSDDSRLPAFSKPEAAQPLNIANLETGGFHRTRQVDYASGVETYESFNDTGLQLHKHTGLKVRSKSTETFQIHPDDPNSARGICVWQKSYSRGNWRAELKTLVKVEALREAWKITASLEASDAEGEVLKRDWSDNIPRDLV